MCVIAAYGVQFLVAACRGSGAEQQAVCLGRGMLLDCYRSRATSLIPNTWLAALHLNSNDQQPRHRTP